MRENQSSRARSQLKLLSRLGLGLLLTPCAVALASRTLTRLEVQPWLAGAIAFAGATLPAIIGLWIAATAEVALGLALGVGVAAAASLLTLAWTQASSYAAVLVVDTALVSLAWSLGTSLGRRVQHPSHLFPACVVAASADLVSLLSPEGPSHAIAASDRALSVLAVWFPVPGSEALAPALGVGDLLFMALVFGVARVHGLPYARCLILCALGTLLAGLAAARLGVAVPALVTIAGAVLFGLPSIRRLRRTDRTAALLSMLVAGSVAAGAVARSIWVRH